MTSNFGYVICGQGPANSGQPTLLMEGLHQKDARISGGIKNGLMDNGSWAKKGTMSWLSSLTLKM